MNLLFFNNKFFILFCYLLGTSYAPVSKTTSIITSSKVTNKPAANLILSYMLISYYITIKKKLEGVFSIYYLHVYSVSESACYCRLSLCTYQYYRAVVRGGAGDALAPPEFGALEKRTEREIDSLLLSAPPCLKT